MKRFLDLAVLIVLGALLSFGTLSCDPPTGPSSGGTATPTPSPSATPSPTPSPSTPPIVDVNVTTTTPTNPTVTVSGPSTFSIAGTHTGTFSFSWSGSTQSVQWYLDGVAVNGATGNTFNIDVNSPQLGQSTHWLMVDVVDSAAIHHSGNRTFTVTN